MSCHQRRGEGGKTKKEFSPTTPYGGKKERGTGGMNRVEKRDGPDQESKKEPELIHDHAMGKRKKKHSLISLPYRYIRRERGLACS